MNKLYVITGPAGVGKSTVSKMIAEKFAKSVLIEGDDIYNMVIGGYVSPWLEGNQLDIFWKNSISLISNFLSDGYDVIFNYIVYKDKMDLLRDNFPDTKIIFVVLMVDEETIIKRDKERPIDFQMGERSLELLREFEEVDYSEKFLLDTSKLSPCETVEMIINDNRFVV